MDLKYAFRSLTRQPLFAFGAIVTLALGIGVNSTIFTLANAALLRPMPGIADADQLVWISAVWIERGREVAMSYPEYVDYRDATTDQFSQLFAFRSIPVSLGSGGDPQRVRGQLVTGSYFSALGVLPAAGRLIAPEDDRVGSPPSVVVSHRVWQERFGASAEIAGTAITINGRQFAVIGVAPNGFYGPALGESADVWMPLAHLAEVRTANRELLTQRGASWLSVMGRLRPGASMSSAQTALSTVASRLEGAYRNPDERRGVLVSSARSGLAPESRSELAPLSALLLAVTGIVLLIACANVANLLLARGAGRATELSIRAAIGASRRRLLRQLLTESLLLAVLGGVAGLLVSSWVTDLVQARLPEAEFRGLSASPDARVLSFTALLAVLSVCAFGVAPALTLTRAALRPRSRETSAAGGRSRLQGIFVIAQLSLSLVLLLAGGLSLRALQKADSIDLGFSPSGVLTASYDLELQNYTPERRLAFRRQLRERLGALPGVTAVGLANVPPFSGTMVSTVVSAKDAVGADTETRAYLNAAGPGHFDALEMPIVKGRPILGSDTIGAPRVAVINERLARELWGNTEPIGREIVLEGKHIEVVGVARDAKYDEATEDSRPFMYLSLDQEPQLDRETIVLRTAAAPGSLLPALRNEIQALDPALPVFDVRPLSMVIKDRGGKERGISALLGGFGGVALLLAALGLYSVMGYTVARRTREMGIRIALGASPEQLTALITRDAMRLSLIGVAIGATMSLPLAFALGALLFGVQIADIAAFVLICALLVGVAVAAACLPARRAARLDPVVALRTD